MLRPYIVVYSGWLNLTSSHILPLVTARETLSVPYSTSQLFYAAILRLLRVDEQGRFSLA